MDTNQQRNKKLHPPINRVNRPRGLTRGDPAAGELARFCAPCSRLIDIYHAIEDDLLCVIATAPDACARELAVRIAERLRGADSIIGVMTREGR